MMRLVPDGLREAAAALGAPSWKVTIVIVYRCALPGIMTGVLLVWEDQRRNRAPAVHRPQQPILEHDMSRPFPNAARGHIPVRNEPVRRLAAPGVAGALLIHRHHPYHQHRRQDAPEAHEIMSRNMKSPKLSSTSNEPRSRARRGLPAPRRPASRPKPPRPRAGAPSWRSGALAFLRQVPGADERLPGHLRPPITAFIGPSG